jgi:putative Holliday junction resolvase
MIISLKELKNLEKSKNSRLLGIDVGEKTLGLALSDINWIIATPLETLKRTTLQNDKQNLLNLIKNYNICALILGYPLNMNGTKGPSCERVDKLVEIFQEFPTLCWDERLSTVAVTKTLINADLSRMKRKNHVDKMAAAYILQGVLDGISFHIT